VTERPIDVPRVVFEGQSLKAAKAAAKARGEYDPDRNIRPAWVDAIPVPDPDGIDYGKEPA
jgi:hypothetical protein